jgi:hypothetical protein
LGDGDEWMKVTMADDAIITCGTLKFDRITGLATRGTPLAYHITATRKATAEQLDPNTNLPAFLKEATALINAGKLTSADMLDSAKAAGLAHVGALTQRPDLIATVRATLLAKVKA